MKKLSIFLVLVFSICLLNTADLVAAPKGTIKVGFTSQPSTFDPHRITGFPMNLHYPLVFDNLVFRDRSGKIIPKLAKSWKNLSKTTVEFKLRKGIKFSNGEDLDAHAVKYSLERIVKWKKYGFKKQSRQIGYFRSLSHVDVVDKYTVHVHSKYPDQFMISPLTSYGAIVPPKYYSSTPHKKLARKPIGSGPYVLKSWKKGEELVYVANPNYWDKRKLFAPKFKKAIVKIIPEPTTRVSALLSGELDLINQVPPQWVGKIKSNPNLDLVSAPSVRTCFVVMIIKKDSPWASAKVRKAMNYAVNKDLIVNTILKGYAKVVATNVGPTSFGYNPDLKPYPYDPELAKNLLAEAGFPNGFEVDLYVPLGRYLGGKEATEAISGMLKKVGVTANVKTPRWGTIVKKSKARWNKGNKPFWWLGCRMDMHLHSEGMYAGQVVSWASWTGFRDKFIDKLAKDARSTIDYKTREKKYQRINRILREDKAPLVFLWQNDQIHAKKKSIKWSARPNSVVLVNEMSR
tara:strand:- start:2022 stop:3569 length:1548 start_codon:yes stop_codon:yes gene_type:complete